MDHHGARPRIQLVGRGQPRRNDRPGQGEGRRGVGRDDRDRPVGRRNVDGRGERRGRNRGELPWRMRLGYNKLNELKEKDSTEILLTIAEPDSGLSEALNDLSIVKNAELMSILLRCIAKACSSSSAKKSIVEVMTIFESSTFLRTTLITYLCNIMQEQSLSRQQQNRAPLVDTIRIVTEMATVLPTSIMSVLGVLEMLKPVIDTLKISSNIIDEELSNMFEDCYALKDNMIKRIQQVQRTPSKRLQDHEEPPDNFREISIFPEKADIDVHIDDVFLRRNKITGGYENLNHYLDVQYRLLREDFIGPLREGINSYVTVVEEKRKNKRVQEMRIYNDIHIICPVCSDHNGLVHRISFDVSRFSRVKWEHSKRLIYGSLLCFSSDNFRTLLFATVADRDPKKVKEGLIDVKFEGVDAKDFHLDADRRYIMAETVAYFEAYRHNLKGLQNIQEGDLPFEKYIIHCNYDVQPPLYLRQNPNATFDLRPLVEEHIMISSRKPLPGELTAKNHTYKFSTMSEGAKEIHPAVKSDWPSPDQLHLDESQFRAVKRALTSEFVLTQGPPGTGKTYIGLKIVKALLHNYPMWNLNHETEFIEHRPMLIVCYTNHALDQFLEGIMDFFKGDILRVGGRSTSETVKRCTLNNLRSKQRESRQVPEAIHRARINARHVMTDRKEEINRIAKGLETAQRELLHEDMLETIMGTFYSELLGADYFNPVNFGSTQQKSSVLFEWLGIEACAQLQENDEENEQNQHRNQDNNFDHLLQNVNDQLPNQDQRIGGQAGRFEEPLNENVPEEELIDVIDEIDALHAQRDLDVNDDDLRANVEDFEADVDALLEDALYHKLMIRPKLALNLTQLEDEKETDRHSEWKIPKKQKKKIKKYVRRELASSDRLNKAQVNRITNVWALSLKDRWRLYRYWVNQFCERMRGVIRAKTEEYQTAYNMYREVLMQEDKSIMKNASIIGMTTTGAARYQAVLQEISPRVIVVEEAAEVLEAHVVTTLSSGCEHLILIGDHKQLKPNPNVYKLAKDFNLDLSLFERMVKNKMECDCLELQHRMRPEISEIITLIYPDLKDHEVVKNYENVKGVSSNVFFIDHGFPEENDEDNRSHSNQHEAEYIVGLCKYLLLQGYKPQQITILTLYSGQLFTLRKLMPKHTFEGVRITVVDNFQGEENDIILMSLVRSNEDGTVGFLKIENRICVALSRAKIGLFVIGNMEMIYQNGGRLWRDVISLERRNGNVGEGLQLHCQNHKNDKGIVAKTAKDFRQAPEGGCMKLCEFRLNCGHTCGSVCHVLDPEHEFYECKKPCERVVCDKGHRCKKRCFQDCGDCRTEVQKRIPSCGHYDTMPCHKRPESHICKKPCRVLLECGHACKELCGSKHTLSCQELVEKRWDCGHIGKVACCDLETALCNKPCEEILKCDHPCSGTCGQCMGGRLHVACRSRCNRPLICGHMCQDNCSFCPPCRKKCQNRCKHSKCQRVCGNICVPCNEPCEWQCRHHQCTKLCHEPCDRERCNLPCRKRLKCRHACIGLCGEKCPSLCRVCNRDLVTEIFFGTEDEPDARFVELEDCGHVIEVTGMDYLMDQATEDEGEIQLKVCPKCKTPIRRNLRYGNLIKSTLQHIEKVKETVLGSNDRIKKLRYDVPKLIRDKLSEENARKMKTLFEIQDQTGVLSEISLVAMENQIEFLSNIQKQKRLLEEEFKPSDFENNVAITQENLKLVREWVLTERLYFTDQELDDIRSELKRMSILRKFYLFKRSIKKLSLTIDGDLQNKMDVSIYLLTDKKKFTESRQIKVNRTIKMLKEVVPASGLGISEEERVQIVSAMQLGKGHWFKCPNGHVYAIGDCGGATMESKCPQCNARIGGQGHQLRTDNALASEMDGAQRPAWPTALDHMY